MRFIPNSITTKLLLLFFLVGLSSVMIVGSYSFHSAKKAIMSRTTDQLVSVRTIKKQQIEYLFDVKIRNLRNLASSNNTGQIRSGFRDLCDAYGFQGIYLSYYSGNHSIIRSADSVANDYIPPSVISVVNNIKQDLKSSDVAVSDMFFRLKDDSVPVILMGCRLTQETADSAIVVTVVEASEINSIMLQDNSKSGLGKTGEAYIVGNDLKMRSQSRFTHHSILRVPVHSETVVRALKGDTGTLVTSDYRGIRVLSAYEPLMIPGLKWAVLAEIDYEEAMIPVSSLRNDILLVSLVISLLILGFSQIITRMITQPIKKLKNAAVVLGQGNFNNKVPVKTRDEIGLLAETFNNMSDQLRDERLNRLKALFDGQEMERRRISRELHDGLGQKLVGAKLQIENCNDRDMECLQKTMNESKSNLHSIVDELRRISNDLAPAALNELGLETALQNLCNDVELQTGIETEFESGLLNPPDEKVSVYLFRISQEAIQNIIKHSGATVVSFHLLENREMIILMIEDNGKGFSDHNFSGGNGLINMKERATLLGGTFSIESSNGKGTTIRVKIPVSG